MTSWQLTRVIAGTFVSVTASIAVPSCSFPKSDRVAVPAPALPGYASASAVSASDPPKQWILDCCRLRMPLAPD